MQSNTTMAQPLLATSVGAPPGFATTAFIDTMSSQAAAVPVFPLNISDVQRLAAQERWRTHDINHQGSVVTFSIERAGETIRVNVFYDKAAVGIMFSHPRMGQTQSFRFRVDLSELRKIFRDPRMDGYSNIKKRKKKPAPRSCNNYAIGDRVHVKGYDDAIIIGAPRWPGDLARIRFADGCDFRVETSQLAHIGRSDPFECKNLEAEAVMQLERLDNELERIMKEKMRCEQIIQLKRFGGSSNFGGIHDVNKHDAAFLNGNHRNPKVKDVSASPPTVIGAFESYYLNKGNNCGSVWSAASLDQRSNTTHLENGAQQPSPSTILPPFFPTKR